MSDTIFPSAGTYLYNCPGIPKPQEQKHGGRSQPKQQRLHFFPGGLVFIKKQKNARGAAAEAQLGLQRAEVRLEVTLFGQLGRELVGTEHIELVQLARAVLVWQK